MICRQDAVKCAAVIFRVEAVAPMQVHIQEKNEDMHEYMFVQGGENTSLQQKLWEDTYLCKEAICKYPISNKHFNCTYITYMYVYFIPSKL